ncbi:Rqc2 family fibronectin-binding protein [Caldalkalibacillus salinus]|uniref:Rqc2 family fibronectin-binding protein n=1 Tax=Caldalkalibacillus salinus TaxID=2803787 RepID=UPI0019242B41|nr:NFACT RNA binding domain-containing protein [Caldalkalibacillus salinus]
MSFDGMVVHAITQEIQSACLQGRIAKIYQPYERDLIIHIRAHGRNHRLLISANPSYPRMHLTEETFINPKEAPMFCMLLRKHLEGAVIEDISQVDNERMIEITVRGKDELGDTAKKRLVVELMGRHSNIILVDPERNMILDSIHHVTPAISQYRVVLPGQSYVYPPEQNKLNPFLASEDTLLKKINFNQGKIDQQIVNTFSGVSPLFGQEVLHRAGLPNRESVAHSFFQLIDLIKQHDLQPAMMTAKNKEYFYLFPLEHLPSAQVKSYASVSKLLEAFYHGKAERDQVKQRANDLIKFVQNERKKNQKKIKKFQQTQKDSEKAEQHQLFGELLTAYMHQVKRGDTSVEVVNYYAEDGEMVSIPLDPEKTPNENAQRYFKAYNKAKRSIEMTEQQIVAAEKEIAYFDVLLQQLEHASPQDIEDIREELIEGGYIKKRQWHKKKKKDDKPLIDQYVSSEGTTIYVGKNNKQNEYLTNRLARSSDTWLHTKDIPGSHVVIRGTDFSEETLLEAAEIAAYFSKARRSSQVPVDYTLIKHVRKPSGAKPGYVTYDNQQTVYVTPKDETVQQLKFRK